MSDSDLPPVGVALENRLMSHGIYLTEWRWLAGGQSDVDGTHEIGDSRAESESTNETPADGAGLAIAYETVSERPTVGSEEVGAVVRTLLDVAAEREWTPGRLEATSYTLDGRQRGRWHVERAWFDGLGLELDDVEFSRRVLETRRETAHGE